MTHPADLVVFDVGGTLIDDPFSRALDAVMADVAAAPDQWHLSATQVLRLFALWREENATSDHSFASHFLQEEVWPARALVRLCAEHTCALASELPQLAARLLARYRDHARTTISEQPARHVLRRALDQLNARGIHVGAASNDRQLATRAMLAWADLLTPMRFVLTSEELSRRHPGAEKPHPEFFHAILAELGRTWRTVIYVGDSERNDIVPARASGLVTVRRVARAAEPSVWLDTTVATTADEVFETADELIAALDRALGSLRP